MKNLIKTLLLLLSSANFCVAQEVIIEGKAKVSVMELNNTVDSFVVRESDGTLALRDISTIKYPINTINPTLIEDFTFDSAPRSMAVEGNYAYIGLNAFVGKFLVMDIESPTDPVLLGEVSIDRSPVSIAIQGDYAYIANLGISEDYKFEIVDISNPAVPTLVGNLSLAQYPTSVAVEGNYAYVTNTSNGGTIGKLQIIDVSNPNAPFLGEDVDLGNSPNSVVVRDNYAYTCNNASSEFEVVDISNSDNPFLAATLDIYSGSISLTLSDNFAFTVSIGADVMQIIDISNPVIPLVVGELAIGNDPNKIKAQGDYAYILNQGEAKFEIVDISNPLSPCLVDELPLGGNVMDFGIQDNYGYCVGFNPHKLNIVQLFENYVDVNDADFDPQNELIINATLNGFVLEIEDAGGTNTVDLSSLQDGAGTDDQTLGEVLSESNDAGNISIVNLADPTNPQDVATKNYVDANDDVDDTDADPMNEIQTLAEVLSEGAEANGLIHNVTDPIADQDAATKAYVDVLETKLDSIENIMNLFITFMNDPSALTVQQRLDFGETPIEIYNSGVPLNGIWGSTYEGGLIFYLDTNTGEGMVAAPINQSNSTQWRCIGTLVGTSTAIGTGLANTDSIVMNSCHMADEITSAAEICYNLELNNYDDWYLPSRLELNEMCNKIGTLINPGFYWNSSEVNLNIAWGMSIPSCGEFNNLSKNIYGKVRAVRNFD